ncbi:MAG TPA: hypothetical protein VIP28_01935 [Nocardioides sp.]
MTLPTWLIESASALDQHIVDASDGTKIDPTRLLKTLTGHELALIRKVWGFALTELEDNSEEGLFALAFIMRYRAAWRTGGGTDFKQMKDDSLSLTMGQLMDVFDLEEQKAVDPMAGIEDDRLGGA